VRRVLLLTAALVACSDEPGEPATLATPKPCDELSAPTEGGACARAGVAACGPGFTAEGGGCRALLPDSCAPGTMALPGEESCRPVAACADGPWAGIPREGSVLFVRAGAPPGGDGTEGKPFARIQSAVSAATAGAVIAIDDGAYDEDVVTERSVKLWGRCPSTVILRGVALPATIEARADLELHRLSVRGGGTCVWISGSPNALLDEVWIHDCGARGIEAAGYGGTSRTRVSRSLIERVRASGIGGFGAEVTLERSVLRDVSPRAGVAETGDGILMRPEKSGTVVGSLTVRESVIERSRLSGITLSGVPGTIEMSVVRDVATIATRTYGLGVYSGGDPPTGNPAARLELTNVVIERTHSVGLEVDGGDTKLASVTIRDVAAEPASGNFGYGIQVSRGTLDADALAVERAHGGGICVHGSVATIAHAWVSETLAEADARFGDGIVVSGDERDSTRETRLTLTSSRVQKNARAGVSVFGSTASIATSALACNRFDVHVGARVGLTAGGEPIEAPFALHDLGGNQCGCGAVAKCVAQSENLEPLRTR